METQILEDLIFTVRDRKINPVEGSYTCALLNDGKNKLIKKIGEETAELIQAISSESDDRVISEVSDLVYHLIVTLESKNIKFEDVFIELKRRFGK